MDGLKSDKVQHYDKNIVINYFLYYSYHFDEWNLSYFHFIIVTTNPAV